MAAPAPPTIRLRLLRGRRISLDFAFDRELLEAVRAVPGRRWDAAARRWTIPHSAEAIDALLIRARVIGIDLDPRLAGLATARTAPPEPAWIRPVPSCSASRRT